MQDASKIVLGTVQFGLDYGINNKVGKPSRNEVFRILNCASSLGIDTLDTANAYGDSELLLGAFFKEYGCIFKVCSKFSETANLAKRAKETIERLKIPQLQCFSFHNYEVFNKITQSETQELLNLKERGLIKKIG